MILLVKKKSSPRDNLKMFVIVASFDLSLTNVSPRLAKDKRMIFQRIYMLYNIKVIAVLFEL